MTGFRAGRCSGLVISDLVRRVTKNHTELGSGLSCQQGLGFRRGRICAFFSLSDDFLATVISFFFFCFFLFITILERIGCVGCVEGLSIYGKTGEEDRKTQKGEIEVIATFGRSQSTIHSFIHSFIIM
jgi:hypothetical protein